MKGKHLTPKEFEKIKSLQMAEIKEADVCRLLKKSRGVVHRVYRTDSIQDYKEKCREANMLRKKPEADVEVVPTHEGDAVALMYEKDFKEMQQKLDLIIESLDRKKFIL